MQLRRLDPLANAGPYQRLGASPVKSLSLTEAQFERVRERRPELVLLEGDRAVIGRPQRDFLEVHYGFPDIEAFQGRFAEMFEQVVGASSKQEAPRGLVLSFRDRPNRMVADTVFWPLALDEGPQWVEWNYVSVPEQPEPGQDVGEGFVLRDAGEGDRPTVGSLDGEARGQPPLTDAGIESVFADAKLLRIVADKADGSVVGYLHLRGEPGGWGIVDTIALRPAAKALRGPLLRWSIAWLRNNGGRRMRQRVPVDDSVSIALLREAGFTPGESGLDYTRTVDVAEAKRKLAARQSHGTIIKFGDWR